MLSLVCWLSTLSVVLGACYDAGGKFTMADWPVCHEASPDITVYSNLEGDFLKLGVHFRNHTGGWSALGFAGNGGMKGASQIVVRKEANAWVAEDRYSLDYVTPVMDEQQDAKLTFADDDGVSISWAVVIPKDSCDINDYPVEAKSRIFLWAKGASHTFDQHTARGQFHANLVKGLSPEPSQVGTSDVELRMPNVTLTAGTTNPYICGVFDLRVLIPARNLSQTVHVSKFSPKLGPAGQYAHHMVLFTCDQAVATNLSHGQVIQDCESMPSGCSQFKWVWAVGSQDVVFPETVGMPVGQGKFFLALQMHYFNPSLVPNVMDDSGVTLSIPATNRAIDAGLYQLNGGTGPNMRPDGLPALSSRFTLKPQLYVPKECTDGWQSNITMLGVFHHMHLLGVRQQIEVFRGGVSLGLLRNERMYDFRHQSLEESAIETLSPGDEFKVTCEYDTSSKSTVTQFGERTDTEMCWAAFMYYPAQQLSDAVHAQLPSTATMDAQAAYCTSPALNQSRFMSIVSKCTEAWALDPILFKAGQQTNANVQTICNVLPAVSPANFKNIQTFFPNVCPPCWKTGSCTQPEFEAWGQTEVCGKLCDLSFSLDVYPSTNRTTVVYPTHQTYCGAGSVLFTPHWPNTTRPCSPPEPGALSPAAYSAPWTLASALLVAASLLY